MEKKCAPSLEDVRTRKKRLLRVGDSQAVVIPSEWLKMMKTTGTVELVLQLDCADADWEIVVRRPKGK